MIELDDSQKKAIEYLTHMPNNLGLIKGPWGTGKIKVDVLVTMLLMSAGKKVKVLSPTNKAADSFVIKLNAELARLQGMGITITDKHVVRLYTPTTEAAVVKADNQRNRTRDTTNERWQHPVKLLVSQYDRMAVSIMEKARERPWGVPDRRYKLHDASFGTLLLQIAGLLGRPRVEVNLAPEEAAVEGAGAEGSQALEIDNTDTINAPEPAEATGGTQENSDLETDSDPEIDDGSEVLSQGGSDDDGYYHHQVGDVYTGAVTDAAQRLQQAVQERTQTQLEEARGLTMRERLCACFREMFLDAERGGLTSDEQWATFKNFERLLSLDILTADVAVLATTLVNSGHTIVKDSFPGDHVIVQEASKAENGDVFIALANCTTSIHLSGDDEQLPPHEQDIARNPFAKQTNRSLYHRWVSLGYSFCLLTEQHRTIPAISNIISRVWYHGAVTSKVDPSHRPNTRKAITAHNTLFNRASPFVWIHTSGESNKMGFSQSSQNERELQVAISLCQSYIEHGVAAKDIVILAGYLAQISLTKRAIQLTPGLEEVESWTIDAYQGEEKSVVILCMVGSQKLGFMSDSARLLTAVSRAGDALAIITNHVGIQTSEHKRKRAQYDYVRYLIGQDSRATYEAELPPLNLALHDIDLTQDDSGPEDLPQDATDHQVTGEGETWGEPEAAWVDEEDGRLDDFS
jgi:hypothetical protein